MTDQQFPDDSDQPLYHPVTGEELPPSANATDLLLIAESEMTDDERWERIQMAARFNH
jgi:hypothetical protein